MKILLAEDEREMSAALTAILSHSGYEVDAVYDGIAAVEKAQADTYDCMVFDIMMPKLDGIDALKKLRSSGDVTPVIMLTAKAEVDDRITGLDAGADDYLTKPFAMGELLARIRSMTRRTSSFTPTKLSVGAVALDVEEQELSCKNSIRLANRETKLMKFFMLNAGKALPTDVIFTHVWKDETDVDETIVWMYVSYLREKLDSINADIQIKGDKGEDFLLTEK
ncbi:transcriptional regulator [Megasphaera cerevisiae DSM 20462]|uniref:Transcriptional regulator n=1 Tax=Megasphaera cerevisiae DSM 20462 TaxID=1122219 RepID=A0A0J6WV30_9FIRM|nr:response regulator transcription factor [Megasphaera cerevisiae]KMO85647.1 transcriptional regulator [Megasphaera cerevisiae DSM 20462]SKA14208.1 DNA-binding response regulator, OmpR family, contains REC and winged-helix (wHTH) domain [Megasphaera cerevisiae DSM 20462]